MLAQPLLALLGRQLSQLAHLGVKVLPGLGCGGSITAQSLPPVGHGRNPVVISGQCAKAGVVGLGDPAVGLRQALEVLLAQGGSGQQGLVTGDSLRSELCISAAEFFKDFAFDSCKRFAIKGLRFFLCIN